MAYIQKERVIMEFLRKHRDILNITGFTNRCQLPDNFLKRQMNGRGGVYWSSSEISKIKVQVDEFVKELQKLQKDLK